MDDNRQNPVSTGSLNFLDHDSSANLLPADGIVNYYGPILPAAEAWRYHDTLLQTISWKNDETILFGKRIVTARKVAWYGDRDYSYTYSGTTKHALHWTNELRELKSLVEKLSGDTYNSCLLNLYHTGEEGMGWHSDDEKMIGKDTAIASMSFGAERKFSFKHKRTGETVSVMLEHGSLLLMKGTCQTYWLHRLPPTKKLTTPRINLTFRTIILS
ncbi:MAG TPA: alpha-ketoglutarate-dependent dioxygenase AlkB [Verrucomicrobiae bacterium]